MIQSMDVRLGAFDHVIGVAVNGEGVSIIDRARTEMIIPIRAHHRQFAVTGEFGDPLCPINGARLLGIEPQQITRVDIVEAYNDPALDYHTKVLRLQSANGLTLSWELFCDEN